MTRAGANGDGDGIVACLKDTADGLGQLIADHVKLARVELAADARIYGREMALPVVASTLVVIGYVFGWMAAALALAHLCGATLSFALVAAFHLIVGLVGIASVLRKMRQTRLMCESGMEAARSVRALTSPLVARTP